MEDRSSSSELIALWRDLHASSVTPSAGAGAAAFVGEAMGLDEDGDDEELDFEGLFPPGAFEPGLTRLATLPPIDPTTPEVLFGMALVETGDRTDEGHIILAVTPAWRWVLRALESDPNALNNLDWRQTEELVAGAYREYGWTVTLTPRSNDRGRDIIAYRDDIGAVRFLEQVKAYKPGHIVTAEEVRALFGVLANDPKASKGVITTTSTFAPGVFKEFANRTPTRLELRDGAALRAWLQRISSK